MNETLLGVFAGAIAAALPQLVIAISAYLSSKKQRQHEIRVRQLDVLMPEQQKCYISYLRLLQACREEYYGNQLREDVYHDYCEAYGAIMLYVSDSTRRYLEPFSDPSTIPETSKRLPDLEKHLHDDLFAGIS